MQILVMRQMAASIRQPPTIVFSMNMPHLLRKEGGHLQIADDDTEIYEFDMDPDIRFDNLRGVSLNCTRTASMSTCREFFSRCPQLRNILIRDGPKYEELELHNLKHLRLLNLQRGRMRFLIPDSMIPISAEPIPCFHELKIIYFFQVKLSPTVLTTLGRITSLRRLSLDGVRFLKHTTTMEEDNRVHDSMGLVLQQQIGSLPELRLLSVKDVRWKKPFELSIQHEKLLSLELEEEERQYSKARKPYKMKIKSICCPRLRSCVIDKLGALETSEGQRLMRDVVKTSPWLSALEGSPLITELTLQSRESVPSACPTLWNAPLVRLVLDKCTLDQVDMEKMLGGLWRLHTLKLTDCRGMASINNCFCPSVQALRIHKGSMLIGPVDLKGFPHLQKATLQLGTGVTSLVIKDLPLLISLKMPIRGRGGEEERPASAALEEIVVEGVPQLRTLRMEWYPPIKTLRLHADWLEECSLEISCQSFLLKSEKLDSFELCSRLWTNIKEDLPLLLQHCKGMYSIMLTRLRDVPIEWLQQIADLPHPSFEHLDYRPAPTDEAMMSRSYLDEEHSIEIIPTRLKRDDDGDESDDDVHEAEDNEEGEGKEQN